MHSNWNQELGYWGEMVAKRYLLKQGYQLIDQNVHLGKGEIDLVMKYRGFLVLVEVKTKIDNQSGEPAELVTAVKLSQIMNLVEGLLADKKICQKWRVDPSVSWYVDVVAVYGNGLEVNNLLHFENVTMWL